jgi:hypothetical protein
MFYSHIGSHIEKTCQTEWSTSLSKRMEKQIDSKLIEKGIYSLPFLEELHL